MIGSGLQHVFSALEYQGDKGLLTIDSPPVEDGRAYVWRELRDKFTIDAAYFHGNVPVVYFKEYPALNEHALWELHRSLWNHNRAPLLIVILPLEVRVYNCFAPPQRTAGQPFADNCILLKEALQQLTDVLTLRQLLSPYNRREIVSGRFAFSQPEFNREQRVDQRLLDNLKSVRTLLKRDNLDEAVANSLLGRSIFIRYLEDRGVIGPNYFRRFKNGLSFHNLLKHSFHETYQLFEEVARHFNGDLFPVSEAEKQQVTAKHLELLGQFLAGDEVSSGQLYFWAYDFKYIPIELISAIYETFLGDNQRNTSAYYTPPEIVDYVLNELLPFETVDHPPKILDPACGSGIFLVEAYRRLVMLRGHAQGDKNLRFEELRDLLTQSIHGVDLNEEAIQVAAFSCYLALLDFLEPKDIWEQVRFPPLRGTNLFVSDFFDVHAPFNEQRYEIILGNPPWQSRLTALAKEYVRVNDYPIGDKQIAQAFLWRAPTLLTDDGRACLLSPSKGVLFNKSKPNRQFRQGFFMNNQVTQVVDFSAFRHSIFSEAAAPMVAIFCQAPSDHNARNNEFRYLSPHPSKLSESLAGIVLFADEAQQLSRRHVATHPYIWKVALWASVRDFTLLEDLRERFPSVEEVANSRNWQIGAGMIGKGSNAIYAPELRAMRYVPVSSVRPFFISSSPEERINRDMFHWLGNVSVYQGPHVLIRRGVLANGVIASAFLQDNAVFTNGLFSITGPSEDTAYLKIMCAYLNSSLARYYQFLTASQWGVERDEVYLAEHKTLPCAIPVADTGLFHRVVALVDQLQEFNGNVSWQRSLDELVYEAYGVTASEQQVVEDFLGTVMTQHYEGLQANAFKTPSTNDLVIYAQGYADVFKNTTGGNRVLVPIIYEGDSPYRAVSFRLAPRNAREQHPVIASEPELEGLLARLEETVTEQYAQSLYFRRNIKVFEAEAIHIVKPAERRFWTKSAAFNDADETIAQLLRTTSHEGTV